MPKPPVAAASSVTMPPPEHPMVAVPEAILKVLEQTAYVVLERANNNTNTNKGTIVSLRSATWSDLLHQTLDANVVMAEPGYPAYRASIMDGYAIRTSESFTPSTVNSNGQQSWTHRILDKVYAGDKKVPTANTSADDDTALASAYYITTGALVPETFDCVVPIEECAVSVDEPSNVAILESAIMEPNKWIRSIGCDTPAGSVVLERGATLDAASIGLLYQSGVDQIVLKPALKVGVLSTGNELLSDGCSDDGTSRMQGRIPDVNRPILLSLLSTFGTWCQPVDLGIRRDDNVPLLVSAIRTAMQECDVIISTGGISKGETDVMERVLVNELGGSLHFGRLHMKPGKPTTFVTIPSSTDDTRQTRLFFAMPGNPVSATVCTQLLVKPCLDLLHNGPDESSDTHGESIQNMVYRIVQNAWLHPEVTALLVKDTKLDKERPEYQRVVLRLNDDRQYEALSTGVQRSSRLMSMRDAHGLMVLPQGVPGGRMNALAGEEYTVLLLHDDPIRRVQVHSSLHLSRKAHKSFQIAVVYVTCPKHGVDDESLASISNLVRSSLSGTKSGPATIVSSRCFTSDPMELFDVLKQEKNADVIVVACASFQGSFRYHLDVSATLSENLTKVADSLALQVRRGAASEVPEAALFECVVGYLPYGRGAIVVCLSVTGLGGALGNVRGLLKHALQVARPKSTIDGRPHNQNP